MNDFLIATIVFLALALLGAAFLIFRQRKMPASTGAPAEPLGKAVSAAMAGHVRMLGEDIREHVDSWGSAIRTDIAKAVHHPAAPAAPTAADTPPSTAAPAASEPAAAPSAGANGTVQVEVVVTQSDRVLAKHAALDKRIADGVAAQVEKDALTAAQAALDKLTEAA